MSGSTQDPEDTSPWTRPRFVVAAVVVALIAVFAGVLAVTRPTDEGGAAAPPPAAATPTVTSSAPADDASVCGLEPGGQDVPVTTPPDTEWELVGTVAAPTAPETIGPGVVEDGLRSCFVRSPLGALYAAANVLATTTVDGQGEALVRNLAAGGEGRDAALAALAEESGGSSTRIQVAGYNFLNYDAASTVIDLAIRAETGAYAHLPLTMRWEDGDWKVVFPTDGDLAAAVQQLPDLTGYVPWGGA